MKICNECKSENPPQNSGPETEYERRTLDHQNRWLVPRHTDGRSDQQCDVSHNSRRWTRQLEQVRSKSTAQLPGPAVMLPGNPDGRATHHSRPSCGHRSWLVFMESSAHR